MATALAEDELLAEVRLPLLARRRQIRLQRIQPPRRRFRHGRGAGHLSPARRQDRRRARRRRRRRAAPAPHRRSRSRAQRSSRPATRFSAPPPKPPQPRSIRWRITRPRPTTAATWCAPWCAARWNRPRHDRAHQRLGTEMGRPRHPAAGGPGAGHRARPLHRRSAGGALGALRAQPGGRRHDCGKIDTPDGALVVTAADLNGVKPILPMLHKFTYKPVAPAGTRRRRRALCRRAGRRGRRGKRGRSRGHRRPSRARRSSRRMPVIDAQRGAGAGHAANARRGARQCHPRRQGQDRRLRRGLERRAQDSSRVEARSHRQNATPMEARAATPLTTPPPAASRSPAPRRCRISCAPPSPTCSACRRAICA